MPSCGVCMSVCPPVCLSVTFVGLHSVKTKKYIFKISFTILVFFISNAMQYSDGNYPNEGMECRWIG